MIFAPEGAFSLANWYVSWSLNKALDYNVCCSSVIFSLHCVGNTQMEIIALAWQLFVNTAPAGSGFRL